MHAQPNIAPSATASQSDNRAAPYGAANFNDQIINTGTFSWISGSTGTGSWIVLIGGLQQKQWMNLLFMLIVLVLEL